MQRTEILEKLKEVLKTATGEIEKIDSCSEDSSLIGDLGLNSIGILYAVIAIEEFFGISFEDVGFSDFKTVKNVVDYVETKLN